MFGHVHEEFGYVHHTLSEIKNATHNSITFINAANVQSRKVAYFDLFPKLDGKKFKSSKSQQTQEKGKEERS
jgi:hypothetical protein